MKRRTTHCSLQKYSESTTLLKTTLIKKKSHFQLSGRNHRLTADRCLFSEVTQINHRNYARSHTHTHIRSYTWSYDAHTPTVDLLQGLN